MRILVIVLALCASAFGQATQSAATKKLIEFGWDEPDTAFMRKHVAEMGQTPFDGTVYHISYRKPDGSKGSFGNDCWGACEVSMKEVIDATNDLKATPFKKFTHNFLRFNVCPGTVDWFDDKGYAAVGENAWVAARVAQEGKSAGILFDIEQYNTHLWEYAKQKQKDSKSFDDYARQARQRGRQIMKAFQDGYPDLTVFLTFGYSLPQAEMNGKLKLSEVEYGLLAPFLDGMFDVAGGKAKIVDGFEISYGWKEMSEFDDGLKTMREGVLPIVGDPAKYKSHMSAGFGLWLDHDWRKNAWDETDFSKNHFTPEQFGASLKKAMANADEYVWIYTETPRWWSEAGHSVKLPQPYVDAIKSAAGK